MEIVLFLEYKQASLTIDLSHHAEIIKEKLGPSMGYNFTDGHLHRFYMTHLKMRDLLVHLSIIHGVRETLEEINASMKRLDIDFDLHTKISSFKPSIFTIDNRSN